MEGNQRMHIEAPLFPSSVLTPAPSFGYPMAECEPRCCGPRARPRAESGETPARPHILWGLLSWKKRYLAYDQWCWEWEFSQRLRLNSDLFSCFWKCNNLSIKALSICQNNACPFVQTKELQLLCKHWKGTTFACRGEKKKNPICNEINDTNVAKRRMGTHLTLGQEKNEVSLPTLMK